MKHRNNILLQQTKPLVLPTPKAAATKQPNPLPPAAAKRSSSPTSSASSSGTPKTETKSESSKPALPNVQTVVNGKSESEGQSDSNFYLLSLRYPRVTKY